MDASTALHQTFAILGVCCYAHVAVMVTFEGWT